MARKIQRDHLLKGAGIVLGFAGIGFVIRKIIEYSGQIIFSDISFKHLIVLSVFVLLYAGFNILLAIAWQHILVYLGIKTDRKTAIRVYGLSQIAKYVPGNIFHFAGRQAIGQSKGWPASPLARSVLWELGLLAIAGSFYSILLIPLLLHSSVSIILSTVVFLLVVLVVAVAFRKWLNSEVAWAWCQHVLFLFMAASLFFGVFGVSSVGYAVNLNLSTYVLLVGVYVVAWLAGLVIPGVPAGIGVREAVFLWLLQNQLPAGLLLESILLGRLVTILGDVLFYFTSLAIRTDKSPNGFKDEERQKN